MERSCRTLWVIPQRMRGLISCFMAFLFVPIVSIAISGFIGCASNPKAVDDAMKTTITMRGKSFVPPPRSVDDILSVIDREAKKDTIDLNRWERKLRHKLPENATNSELIEFHFNRGEAASR